ncbi:hypothetical protein ScalyP_jg12112 [Parmales sp. scaly parma]|nr:hypothetical protein ScalyP_jg12112 [Parmales sp. scaly parma]
MSSAFMQTPTFLKASTASSTTNLFEKKPVERGVSIDQDGKSNIWAIEPKVEVDSSSNEEKVKKGLLAVGGLGLAVVGAGLILTNLPNMDNY